MRRFRNLLFFTLLFLVMAFAVISLSSPYKRYPGFAYPSIQHTVVIGARADSVFHYLGQSSNASKWSVFVDHITPLNGEKIKDGKPGCIRRCFKNKNEKGLQWDEEITVAEPYRRRQLTIFNMKDFPVRANGLATEQLYEQLSPQQTKLTFTLFFRQGYRPSFSEKWKTYVAAYRIKTIFRKNMENIKANLERKES